MQCSLLNCTVLYSVLVFCPCVSGIGAGQMREFGKICSRLEMGRIVFADQVQNSFHAVLSAKGLLMIPEIGIL